MEVKSQSLPSLSEVSPDSSLIVNLAPGSGGSVRTVSAGKQKEGGKGIYLGEDPKLAIYYAILERSTMARHIVLAVEALALGRSAGIDDSMLYTAIAGAAGSSWAWREILPALLASQKGEVSISLQESLKALDDALKLASTFNFSAPLTALARQLFSLSPKGSKSATDVYNIYSAPPPSNSAKGSADGVLAASKPGSVGFIGLGAMGYGMSTALVKAGLSVKGWDVWEPARKRYADGGGVCAASIEDCARSADILVLMVVNAAQAAEVLLDKGAVKELPENAIVILMSTVGPTDAVNLAKRIKSVRSDVSLIDAPVSGGTFRAADGDLTILCAGLDSSGPRASEALFVLQAQSQAKGKKDNLVIIPGGAGSGAGVKLVNQHLAGTHISSACETLAFAKRLGLPLRETYELLISGPAQSWMLGDRGKKMMDGLYQPAMSAVNIFVKDMGLVVNEAKELESSVPMASIVQQQFEMGKANGWGGDDDSSLVRLWMSGGIDVRCP